MSTTLVSQVQQQRKIIDTQDCGFKEANKVKRIRIRYTPYLNQPPLIDFTTDLSSYKNKEEPVEKPATMKIRIKYNPPPAAVPPLMVVRNNNTTELSFNEEQNKRLILNSKMCGNTFRKAYFGRKKLCLVLDLDHTLLHSVRIQDVSAEDQEYLNLRVSSMKDLDGNSLYRHIGRYIKLRPYTREFLKEVGKYFELFIYTMGTRDYAAEMGRLLDPQGVLFKSIVSKDDSTNQNRMNLDILAGPNESNTIIVDDTRRVWEENEKNLIQIEKYNYFTEGGHRFKKDEEQGYGDEDGALKSISEILHGVHKMFFESYPVPSPVELNEYIKSVDVRPLLQGFLN
ncbi:hypothetical protein MKW98_028036 [Papaver atlanticum]|uniref:RNA polymerase II C-terminal domain phosphatase-like n=1 Tax=Papaver atlanticum TaxID=357466 RepID=A0AAD4SF56_9MAGN|nr:hypothetical protein MKW98_028036 [Papaver atlanticum]